MKSYAVYVQWGPPPNAGAFQVEAADHKAAIQAVIDSFQANKIVRIMAVERAPG